MAPCDLMASGEPTHQLLTHEENPGKSQKSLH
jgi:hypothetical protein